MVSCLLADNFYVAIQQRWMIHLTVLWHYLVLLPSVGLLSSRSISMMPAELLLLSIVIFISQLIGIAISRLSFYNDNVSSRLSFSNVSVPSRLPLLSDSVPSRLPLSSDSVPSRSSFSDDSVPSHSSFPNDSVSSLSSQLPFLDGTASSHLSSHDTNKSNQKTYFAKKHAICTVIQILSSSEHVPRKQPRSIISFTIHFYLVSHVVKISSCLLSFNECVCIMDCLIIQILIDFQRFAALYDGKMLPHLHSTMLFLFKHLSLLHLSIYDTNCICFLPFYFFIRDIPYDLRHEWQQLACTKMKKEKRRKRKEGKKEFMKLLLTNIVINATIFVLRTHLAHVFLCINSRLSTFCLSTRCNRDVMSYERQRMILTISAKYDRNGTFIELIAPVAFRCTTTTIINEYRYHRRMPKYYPLYAYYATEDTAAEFSIAISRGDWYTCCIVYDGLSIIVLELIITEIALRQFFVLVLSPFHCWNVSGSNRTEMIFDNTHSDENHSAKSDNIFVHGTHLKFDSIDYVNVENWSAGELSCIKPLDYG